AGYGRRPDMKEAADVTTGQRQLSRQRRVVNFDEVSTVARIDVDALELQPPLDLEEVTGVAERGRQVKRSIQVEEELGDVSPQDSDESAVRVNVELSSDPL